jgi:hypothetical protein
VLTDSTLAGAFGAGSRWLVAWMASLASAYVETALVVTLAAVAGLGVGAFEREGGDSGSVMAANGPSDGTSESEVGPPDDQHRSELSSPDETAR